MYDMNDAEPQMPPTGDLIPDGTFAKVRMTIRPGGIDGAVPMDAGLLQGLAIERRQDARLRVHRGRGAASPGASSGRCFTVAGGKVDEKGVRRAGTSPRPPSAP